MDDHFPIFSLSYEEQKKRRNNKVMGVVSQRDVSIPKVFKSAGGLVDDLGNLFKTPKNLRPRPWQSWMINWKMYI